MSRPRKTCLRLDARIWSPSSSFVGEADLSPAGGVASALVAPCSECWSPLSSVTFGWNVIDEPLARRGLTSPASEQTLSASSSPASARKKPSLNPPSSWSSFGVPGFTGVPERISIGNVAACSDPLSCSSYASLFKSSSWLCEGGRRVLFVVSGSVCRCSGLSLCGAIHATAMRRRRNKAHRVPLEVSRAISRTPGRVAPVCWPRAGQRFLLGEQSRRGRQRPQSRATRPKASAGELQVLQ